MEKKYAALFDLDGTLFDTGDVNYYAYREALSVYDMSLERAYFVEKCNGRHYTQFLPQIMGGTENMESVHKLKKELYSKYLGQARANFHLFEMIKGMTGTYRLAIVTTASRKNTMELLSYFGHGGTFEHMVTQDDITKAKPDPQGYLLAMEHFGIKAENTVIFEDSNVGLAAARETGASVMKVDKF